VWVQFPCFARIFELFKKSLKQIDLINSAEDECYFELLALVLAMKHPPRSFDWIFPVKVRDYYIPKRVWIWLRFTVQSYSNPPRTSPRGPSSLSLSLSAATYSIVLTKSKYMQIHTYTHTHTTVYNFGTCVMNSSRLLWHVSPDNFNISTFLSKKFIYVK
jgi:hypothetical protein